MSPSSVGPALYDGVSSRGRFVFQTRGAGARRPARCRRRRRDRDVGRRRADVVAVHGQRRGHGQPLRACVLVRTPLDDAWGRRPDGGHHRPQPARREHRRGAGWTGCGVDVHGSVRRRGGSTRPGLVRSCRPPCPAPRPSALDRPRRADGAPRAQHLRRAAASRRPRLRDRDQLLLRADRGAGGRLVARLVCRPTQTERAVCHLDSRPDRCRGGRLDVYPCIGRGGAPRARRLPRDDGGRRAVARWPP